MTLNPPTDQSVEPAVEPSQSMSLEPAVRLCIANPWFYPVLVGPGERFRRYAPGLRRRGIDVSVVTVQHPGLSGHEVVNGISVERLPAKSGVRWRERVFVYRLLPRYLKRSDRPDVYQFFSASQWVVPFLWAMKVLRIPSLLVFTLLGEGRGSPLRRWLRTRYFRFLFKSFDSIVTSSGVMTDELDKLGVPLTRIHTIPNGVNLERFRPAGESERADLRRRLDLADEDEVVLFIGAILPRKAVDVLLEGWLEVAAARPRARLVLVGDKNEHQSKFQAFRDKLGGLVDQLPDPTRVTFTGSLPNVEDYLRASDLFVFPSIREGMPNVVPEAMATGLASILTPFKGLPTEFGTPGEHYSLVERTPTALGSEILRLLENRVQRAELGRKARTWVEEHMDVETSLDRFSGLYRELAGRG